MKSILTIIFLIPSNIFATLLDFQKEINSIVDKTKDSVVNIRIIKEGYISTIEPEFFFGYIIPEEKIYKYKTGGLGSGVIISEDGYVVTNYHVIDKADEISIESYENNKKTVYKGSYIGGDKNLDIAIIKIEANKKFKYLPFSNKSVNVGDIVVAIGYPFGFKQTYTMGIISAKNVSLKVEGKAYNNLLQTDAAINQGNSGGPLVNIDGEICGINSAIYSPSGAFAGIGFAIPSWRVKEVVDNIIYKKTPLRGWLGISLIPTDLIMKKVMTANIPQGGIINKIIPNSPAEKSGLKRGDIIVSIDDEEVESDEDVFYKIYYKKPGEKIKISFIRDGKKYEKDIILAQRPDEEDLIDEKQRIKQKTNQKDNLKNTFNYKGITLKYEDNKAVVIDVKNDSPLKGYLEVGDIITSINNRRITSYDDMKEIFSKLDISEGALFDITRDGEPFYLSIQIK